VRFRSERFAVLALASLRLAFCGYRAAHQSITVDEAFTFTRFLKGPWSDIYGNYDANNHVLYSILAKLSIQSFGLTELSIRLPSLIAGFFLTLAIFEVLRWCTRSIAVRWLALIGLSLQPMLLDFSVAARGYGLGLTFLMWAMFFAMRRRYAASGVMTGLALSANLTTAFPAAGLLCAVFLLDDVSLKERLRNFAVMMAPAETIFVAICFGALRTAGRNNFYIGAPTILESLRQMIGLSLQVTRRSALLGGERIRDLFQFVVLPGITIFMAAAAGVEYLKDRKQRLRLIPLVTLGLASGLLIAAHYAFDLVYPIDRTGLYLVLLFGIAWASTAELVPRLRPVHMVLAFLLIVQFATQLQTGYFILWNEGARMKEAIDLLRTASAGRASGSVKVSTSWYHQPAVEFYRNRWNITEWSPVEWNVPTQFSGNDFYVFKDEDPRKIDQAGIHVIFSDAKGGLVVGTPRATP